MEHTAPTDSPAPQPVPMQPASAPSSTSAAAAAAGSEAPPASSAPPPSTSPSAPPPSGAGAERLEDFYLTRPPGTYSLDEYRWVPVRRKPRADGWTEEKQRRFIETLADTGLVGAAAKAVGMTRESAYKLRRSAHATAFARAWDAARHHAGSFLEDMAFERALEGVEHNVFDENGEVVCTKRVYNDRLLTYLLSHLKPERYGRMAQLLNAQAQLAQAQLAQAQIAQAQIAQAPNAQIQNAQVQIEEPQIAAAQIAEPQITEAQTRLPQITDTQIDDAPNPAAPVAQDENALVAMIQPPNALARIEPPHSAPPVSLDALLRAMEPQMPVPPEELLNADALSDELLIADMYDGELPPQFREQRREKSAEQLKAEALAAKYARGQAIFERLEKEPDGKTSALSRQEEDDLYYYMDPASRNSRSRKRFR